MDLKYFVDEEAKRVVCTISYEESFKTICEDLRKATVEFTPIYGGLDPYEVKRILKRHNYQLSKSTGIAVCYGDDEFDLETGKRIARRKALDKYYSKRDTIFLIVIREFEWAVWRLKDKSGRLYKDNDTTWRKPFEIFEDLVPEDFDNIDLKKVDEAVASIEE